MKHVGFRIVKSHEAIFRVQNFLQRLMDAGQQLIKIGGLIERVDDVGNNLALGLHAVQIGDVVIADNNGFHVGIVEIVVESRFEPTPGTILARSRQRSLLEEALIAFRCRRHS